MMFAVTGEKLESVNSGPGVGLVRSFTQVHHLTATGSVADTSAVRISRRRYISRPGSADLPYSSYALSNHDYSGPSYNGYSSSLDPHTYEIMSKYTGGYDYPQSSATRSYSTGSSSGSQALGSSYGHTSGGHQSSQRPQRHASYGSSYDIGTRYSGSSDIGSKYSGSSDTGNRYSTSDIGSRYGGSSDPSSRYGGGSTDYGTKYVGSSDLGSRYSGSSDLGTKYTSSDLGSKYTSSDLGTKYGGSSDSRTKYGGGGEFGTSYGGASSEKYGGATSIDNSSRGHQGSELKPKYSNRYGDKEDSNLPETQTTRKVRPPYERYKPLPADDNPPQSQDVDVQEIRSRSLRYRGNRDDKKETPPDATQIKGSFQMYRSRKPSDIGGSSDLEKPVFSSVEDSVESLNSASFNEKWKRGSSGDSQRGLEQTRDSLEKPSFGSFEKDSFENKDSTEFSQLAPWKQRKLEREQKEKRELERAKEESEKKSEQATKMLPSQRVPTQTKEQTTDQTNEQEVKRRNILEKLERPKSVDADAIKHLLLTSESPLLRSRYREAVRKRDHLKDSVDGASDISQDSESKSRESSQAKEWSSAKALHESLRHKEDVKVKETGETASENVRKSLARIEDLKNSVQQCDEVPKSQPNRSERLKQDNMEQNRLDPKKRILVSSRSNVDSVRDSVKQTDVEQNSSSVPKTTVSKTSDETQSIKPESLYSRKKLSSSDSKDETNKSEIKNPDTATSDDKLSKYYSSGSQEKIQTNVQLYKDSKSESEKKEEGEKAPSKRAIRLGRARHHGQEGPSLVKHMSDLLFEDPKSIRSERKHASEEKDTTSNKPPAEKSSSILRTSKAFSDTEKPTPDSSTISRSNRSADTVVKSIDDKLKSQEDKTLKSALDTSPKETDAVDKPRFQRVYGRAKTTDVSSLLVKKAAEQKTDNKTSHNLSKTTDSVGSKSSTPMTEERTRTQERSKTPLAKIEEKPRDSEGKQPECGGDLTFPSAFSVDVNQMSRAERIARYKEERKKQLAHLATMFTEPSDKGGGKELVPSLFTSSREGGEGSLGRSKSMREGSPQKFSSPVARSKSLREDLSLKKEATESVPETEKEAPPSTEMESFDESGKAIPLTMKIAQNKKLFEKKLSEDEDTKTWHRRSLTDSPLEGNSRRSSSSSDRRSLGDESSIEKLKHRYLFGTDFSEAKTKRQSLTQEVAPSPPQLDTSTSSDEVTSTTAMSSSISSEDPSKSEEILFDMKKARQAFSKPEPVQSFMFGTAFSSSKETKPDSNLVSTGNSKLLEAERTGFVEEDSDAARSQKRRRQLPTIPSALGTGSPTDSVSSKNESESDLSRQKNETVQTVLAPEPQIARAKVFDGKSRTSLLSSKATDNVSSPVSKRLEGKTTVSGIHSTDNLVSNEKNLSKSDVISSPLVRKTATPKTVSKSVTHKPDEKPVSHNVTLSTTDTMSQERTKYAQQVPSKTERIIKEQVSAKDTESQDTDTTNKAGSRSTKLRRRSPVRSRSSVTPVKKSIPAKTDQVQDDSKVSTTSETSKSKVEKLHTYKKPDSTQNVPAKTADTKQSTTEASKAATQQLSHKLQDQPRKLLRQGKSQSKAEQNTQEVKPTKTDKTRPKAEVTLAPELHETLESQFMVPTKTLTKSCDERVANADSSPRPENVPNFGTIPDSESALKFDISREEMVLNGEAVSKSELVSKAAVTRQTFKQVPVTEELKYETSESEHTGVENVPRSHSTPEPETALKYDQPRAEMVLNLEKVSKRESLARTEVKQKQETYEAEQVSEGSTTEGGQVSEGSTTEGGQVKKSTEESGKPAKKRSFKIRHSRSMSDRPGKSSVHRSKTISERELQVASPRKTGDVKPSKDDISQILMRSQETNLDDLLMENVDYLSDIETNDPWGVHKAGKKSEPGHLREGLHMRAKQAQSSLNKEESSSLESLDRKLKSDKASHQKVIQPNQTAAEKHRKDISTSKSVSASSTLAQPSISTAKTQATSSTSSQPSSYSSQPSTIDLDQRNSSDHLHTSLEETSQTLREVAQSAGEVTPPASNSETSMEQQGREIEQKKRRKDKSAMRKSQINAGQEDSEGRRRYISRPGSADLPYSSYALSNHDYSGPSYNGYSSSLDPHTYEIMSKYTGGYDYPQSSATRSYSTGSSSGSQALGSSYGHTSGGHQSSQRPQRHASYGSSYDIGTRYHGSSDIGSKYSGSSDTGNRYSTSDIGSRYGGSSDPRSRYGGTKYGGSSDSRTKYGGGGEFGTSYGGASSEKYGGATSIDNSSRGHQGSELKPKYSNRYGDKEDSNLPETQTTRKVRPPYERYKPLPADDNPPQSQDVDVQEIRSRSLRYRGNRDDKKETPPDATQIKGSFQMYRSRKPSDIGGSSDLEKPVFSSVEDSVESLNSASFNEKWKRGSSGDSQRGLEQTRDSLEKPSFGSFEKDSFENKDSTEFSQLAPWKQRKLEREQKEKRELERAKEESEKKSEQATKILPSQRVPTQTKEQTTDQTNEQEVKRRNILEKLERPKSVDADAIKHLLLTSESPLLRSRYREAVRKRDHLKDSVDGASDISQDSESKSRESSQAKEWSSAKALHESLRHKEDVKVKETGETASENVRKSLARIEDLKNSVQQCDEVPKSQPNRSERLKQDNMEQNRLDPKKRILVSSRSNVDSVRDSVKQTDVEQNNSSVPKTTVSKTSDKTQSIKPESLYSRKKLSSSDSKDETNKSEIKNPDTATSDDKLSKYYSSGSQEKIQTNVQLYKDSKSESEKKEEGEKAPSKRAIRLGRARHHGQEGPSLVKHMSDLLFEDPKSIRSERKHASEEKDTTSNKPPAEKSSSILRTSKAFSDTEKPTPDSSTSSRSIRSADTVVKSIDDKLKSQEDKTLKSALDTSPKETDAVDKPRFQRVYGRAKTTDVSSLLVKKAAEQKTDNKTSHNLSKTTDSVGSKSSTPMTEERTRTQERSKTLLAKIEEKPRDSEGKQPECGGDLTFPSAFSVDVNQMSRAERIARYKEERKKQLAHLATMFTEPSDKGGGKEHVPSLFTSSREGGEGSLGRSKSMREGSPQKFSSPVARSKSLREDLSLKKEATESVPETENETPPSTEMESFDESGKAIPLTMKIAQNKKLFEKKLSEDEDTKTWHRRSLTDSPREGNSRRSSSSSDRRSLGDESSIEKLKHRYLFGTDFSEAKTKRQSLTQEVAPSPPQLDTSTSSDEVTSTTAMSSSISSEDPSKSEEILFDMKKARQAFSKPEPVQSFMFGTAFSSSKETKPDSNLVSTGNSKLLEAERTGFVEEDSDAARSQKRRRQLPTIPSALGTGSPTDSVSSKNESESDLSRQKNETVQTVLAPEPQIARAKVFDGKSRTSLLSSKATDNVSSPVSKRLEGKTTVSGIHSTDNLVSNEKNLSKSDVISSPLVRKTATPKTVSKSVTHKPDEKPVSHNVTLSTTDTMSQERTKHAQQVPSKTERIIKEQVSAKDTESQDTDTTNKAGSRSTKLRRRSPVRSRSSVTPVKKSIPAKTDQVQDDSKVSTTSETSKSKVEKLHTYKKPDSTQNVPAKTADTKQSTTEASKAATQQLSHKLQDQPRKLLRQGKSQSKAEQNIQEVKPTKTDKTRPKAEVTLAPELHETLESQFMVPTKTLTKSCDERVANADSSPRPENVPNFGTIPDSESALKFDISREEMVLNGEAVSKSELVSKAAVTRQTFKQVPVTEELKYETSESEHTGVENVPRSHSTPEPETALKYDQPRAEMVLNPEKVSKRESLARTEVKQKQETYEAEQVSEGSTTEGGQVSEGSTTEGGQVKKSTEESGKPAKKRSFKIRHSRSMSDRPGKSSVHRSKTISERELQVANPRKTGDVKPSKDDISQILMRSQETNLDDLLMENVDYLSDIETNDPWGVHKAGKKSEPGHLREGLHMRAKQAQSSLNKEESSSLESLDRKLKSDKASHQKVIQPNQTAAEKHRKDISTSKSVSASSTLAQPSISTAKTQATSSTSSQPSSYSSQPSTINLDQRNSSDHLHTSLEETSQTLREVAQSAGEVTPPASNSETSMEQQDREIEQKKRRKDKSAMRKSQINAGQEDSEGVRGKTLDNPQDDLDVKDARGISFTLPMRMLSKECTTNHIPKHSVTNHFVKSRHHDNGTSSEHHQTQSGRSSVLETILPSKFSIPSKVSSVINRFSGEFGDKNVDLTTVKKPEEKAPRHIPIVRRKNDFSSLLQKFSGSDRSSGESGDSSPRRRVNLHRQEACAVGSSDDFGQS
uniref:Uncharacterized protein n=1 Tax=Magallana gigas TaxID=29159 RepID=A0A8W8KNZ6_MAGGI